MATMREKQLRSIDLNLLPVLDALLRHRNAARAGAEIGLSQPAMSRALGRLRHLLDDPLLVRGGNGLMLSPRAEDLVRPLSALLAETRALLIAPAFDPRAERRVMRIALTDAHAEIWLVPLILRVAAAAPDVVIQWSPISGDLPARMFAGDIDLTLVLDTTPLPRGAVSEPLIDDTLAVVVRQGHPCGARWAMRDYGIYPSVVVSLLGDQTSDIDSELAAAGLARTVGAIVPTFRAAAAIVGATDCVTTISRMFADSVCAPLGLTLLTPPLAQTRLGMVMVWAHYRSSDPMLTWLRAQLLGVALDTRAPDA